MIRVIIERHISEGCLDDYLELIRSARKRANKVDGFIAGELLQEKGNEQLAIIISSWENIEAWDNWYVSSDRVEVMDEMRKFLDSDERVIVLESSNILH